MIERLVDWDVKISDGRIEYFDPTLSYEATGYRPIDDINGLDFDPRWFTKEAADIKERTGKYCPYRFGSKPFRDYWTEQGWRCREGHTINGYTLTGDNYYFVNFYRLLSLDVEKSGDGRDFQFPDFYVEQYKYFHYIALARYYDYDACTLKARGIGWSELQAAIVANCYTWRNNSSSLVTAFSEQYVSDAIKKAFDQLDYNNSNTEGGMRRLRQVKDQALYRKASHVEIIDGQPVESGMKSEIRGIIADAPNKIRGKRVENLIMEEAGSWPNLEKAFEQAKALVVLQGKRIGNIFLLGTGGDTGPNLSGLNDIFTSPKESGILGYKHNYTKTGEYCITGYFVPAYNVVRDCMDNRGYVPVEKGKAYYQEKRDELAAKPKKLLTHCAEYCWTPDEALSLEGDDTFNTVLLTEQKSRIVLFKQTPEEYKPKIGRLEYSFKGNEVDEDNIDGIEFVPDANGHLVVIEPPLKADDGSMFRNLYVAGIDGIDMGMEDTSEQTRDPSQFCIVIKRRMHGMKEPMYVAMYLFRSERVNDDYMQALRLIQWYNARTMIEKTRIGFLAFMDHKRLKYRYMMRRPHALESDKSNSSKNAPFGAPATEAAINHGLNLIKDFVDEYCHTIWIVEMIDQLCNYSYEAKRKYDIVAAMQMAELADEELSAVSVSKEPALFKAKAKDVYVYGYYTDANGYKRRGKVLLKKKPQKRIKTQEEYEEEFFDLDGQIYNSNPIYNGDI